VAITQDIAVTASHCVPETVVNFTMAPDQMQAARHGRGFVVVRDPTSDLALFATAHLVPAELRESPPELDSVASMVSHVPTPWGVVAVHPMEVDDGFVRTERLRVGVSGSGLWDSDWRLIGVAIGNDRSAGYFAGATRIAELLRAVPRDRHGRIDVGSEPAVCATRARDPRVRLAQEGDGFDVRHLLDVANAKNHHIETGLTDVAARVEAEQK
jgi:hypothetical protein